MDLTAPSRAAIELAAILADSTSCDAVLLHVSPEQPPLTRLAELYALAEPIHGKGLAARLRTVYGHPASVICSEASRRQANWVVMGTRGRNGDSGQQTGSVAQAVMKSCTVPVLAIRPRRDLSNPAVDPTLPDFAHCGPDITLLAPTTGPHAEALLVADLLAQARQGRVENRSLPTNGHGDQAAWIRRLDQEQRLIVAPWDPFKPCPLLLETLLREGLNPIVLVSTGTNH